MEKEVTQLSEEISKTNTQKPKKERRLKRLFKAIKKRRKKILLIILGLIIAGSIIGFIVYDQYNQRDNSQPQVFETQPEKLALKGWISSVYDGDTTKKPSVSIYDRVVKVTAVIKLSQDKNINLTTSDQVNLISNGSSYTPLSFSTTTLSQYDKSIEFFFELNKDLTPEALVVKHSMIESPLEMLIYKNSSNYVVNSNLSMVFDAKTNLEYQELEENLTTLVSDTSRLSPSKLPNIDLIIRTPSTVELKYNNQKTTANPSGPGYYPPNYYYGNCFVVNKDTLNPTTDKTSCELYNLTYKVETASRLLGVSRTINIFRNSYPDSLVGKLDSQDSINEIEITILEQKLKLTEIISSGDKTLFVVVKADSGDIYVIQTGKYWGYQPQTPTEIIDLEAKLLLKVLESTKFELQEDVVEVAPSSKMPEQTAPVSYAL